MGMFKRNENDIIAQWGARHFLEFMAKEVYGDGPVVDYYKNVPSHDIEVKIITSLNGPDAQQKFLNLQQHVMKKYGFPLVIAKKSVQEEAVLTFATAVLRSCALTFTGKAERPDPTGFEMGLCIVLAESLCECSALKMGDKYAEIIEMGLLSLSAWMLNYDDQNKGC
jgi:hypothetical protein